VNSKAILDINFLRSKQLEAMAEILDSKASRMTPSSLEAEVLRLKAEVLRLEASRLREESSHASPPTKQIACLLRSWRARLMAAIRAFG